MILVIVQETQMSEINLIAAFFFRAVFFLKNSTPAYGILPIAAKKIPNGIERFLDVSDNFLTRERNIDYGVNSSNVNDEHVTNMFFYMIKNECDRNGLHYFNALWQSRYSSLITTPDFFVHENIFSEKNNSTIQFCLLSIN